MKRKLRIHVYKYVSKFVFDKRIFSKARGTFKKKIAPRTRQEKEFCTTDASMTVVIAMLRCYDLTLKLKIQNKDVLLNKKERGMT